ncbi:hypothetical protein pipiens_003171 [Culex pipiens pipiens]|uniref:G-protein coupled receptors family 1 profile domain-containing protein n=1 Tax=Culex pipiens pipiens TaxID=38569 RepID=A0ABD1D2J3_CULPP
MPNSDGFRRSSIDVLGRAKRRTLKMTITIVTVFAICWTPYYVMSVWYWLDASSAYSVDQRVQKGLFLFACTNSCMNPIVYGVYNIKLRKGRNSVNARPGHAAAVLGLYTINLEDPSYDLKLVGSQTSAHRSNKVVWSRLDFNTATNPNGVIVGGCEGGVIQVYSASKLLSGENALMAQQVKHNGAVRSMDFNPYENKLLASGASESEIYIWDLNNTFKVQCEKWIQNLCVRSRSIRTL